MYRFINKTGHKINILKKYGEIVEILPEGEKATVLQTVHEIADSDGVSICTVKYGEVVNIPQPKVGVLVIVPSIVKEALRDTRHDLVSPDSGPTARRCSDGKVIYVQRLLY